MESINVLYNLSDEYMEIDEISRHSPRKTPTLSSAFILQDSTSLDPGNRNYLPKDDEINYISICPTSTNEFTK